jgi:predicted nucleotidyltransferase component of viral defense system
MSTLISSIIGEHTTNHKLAMNVAKQHVQEIILAGIYRSGAFKHIAFQGGTALRIFYGLDRFSEDLDFCSIDDHDLDVDRMIKFILNEIESFGLDFKVGYKKDDNAFIKGFTIEGNAVDALGVMGYSEKTLKQVHPRAMMMVKVDIDPKAPSGFGLHHTYKMGPYHYGATLLDLPSLFAGKTGAVISRAWKNRVKGRDFYDFEWYINRDVPLNLEYLSSNLMRTDAIEEPIKDRDTLLKILEDRFNSVDYENALMDLIPFVPPDSIPSNWSPEHFIKLSKRIIIDGQRYR